MGLRVASQIDSIKSMAKQQTNFGGLRVAALESRRADELRRMIERLGGVACVSPSMREVPLEDHAVAVDFANRLMTGQIDVVVLMTGVGVQHLMDVIDRHVPRDRFLASLSDAITVARGPKVVAALKTLDINPTFRVPEPNTWRELLQLLDKELVLSQQHIAVQEYGVPNRSLVAGLEARGATVTTVCVYRWELPEDIRPLEQNIRAIAAGEIDVLLLTSANQLHNLLELAVQFQLSEAVRDALRHCVVGSIGPTTSEAIVEMGMVVDFEPSHPKMGHLVAELAERCHDIRVRKKQIIKGVHERSDEPPSSASWCDSLFLKACRREPTEGTPIWLMRQAGRYLPEYRAIRSKVGFLELCKDPALCAQVMVETVQRLGVDAAIIFSDLLPILEPMGLELEYAVGEGPVIHNPVREGRDVDRVVELEQMDALDFVVETVRETRRALPQHLPLIGFAGAPFTLASYMIEGGASRNYLHTKSLMYRDPGAWQELMERLARAIVLYLNAQIQAGAQCVQLFDSWVGCLGPDDYRTYVLPYVRKIVQGIIPGVPLINFATGNPALLPELAAAGPAVVGLDWRVRLDQGWKTVGDQFAVQGNLEPTVLLGDREYVQDRARQVLRQAAGRRGHIFNLGHGVLPETPVDNVLALIDTVRAFRWGESV